MSETSKLVIAISIPWIALIIGILIAGYMDWRDGQ